MIFKFQMTKPLPAMPDAGGRQAGILVFGIFVIQMKICQSLVAYILWDYIRFHFKTNESVLD